MESATIAKFGVVEQVCMVQPDLEDSFVELACVKDKGRALKASSHCNMSPNWELRFPLLCSGRGDKLEVGC